MYGQLFELIKSNNLGFQVWWMPSHLDDPECKKEAPEWVTEAEIQGSVQADRLARIAAKAYTVDINVASKVTKYTHLATKIPKRLATIITQLPKRKRGLYYCIKCGAYSIKKLVDLAAPCPPKEAIGEAGKHNLAKLNLGLLPQGVTAWPDEGQESAPSSSSASVAKSSSRQPIGIAYPGEGVGVPHLPAASSSSAPSPGVSIQPKHYSTPIHPISFNLPDLLALHDEGEQVLWPSNFSAHSATAYIADYFKAINIRALYAKEMDEGISHPIETLRLEEATLAEGGAAAPIPVPEEIKWVRAARPKASAQIRRRCITLKEYNDKKT